MNSVRKCLILAAGRGSRLGRKGVPKPLLPLLGLPLLERVILTAARAGLDDFVVVTGFEGDRVRRFLDGLAVRRGIRINHVVNDEWEAGNGLSAYAARDEIKDEPFVLLMADHLIDDRLLEGLRAEPLEAGTVRLAVDSNTRNPLVDLSDATRVEVEGARVRAIGKNLERYNAFDTGCFVCSASLFSALERARAHRDDTTLSGAIRLLAEEGKVHTFDIGDAFWIDVDDSPAIKRAETALLSRLRKSTDGPVSRHLNRPLSARITRYLVQSPVTPNQISSFCFALSALAAGLFAMGGYLMLALGGLLAQLASVVDGCDGEVARLKFRESAYGGWFDAVLDRYADAFLLLGLTWHVFSRAGSGAVVVVGFLAIVGSFTVSYTADKYDSLMKARFERGQPKGIRIGRDLRVLMISVGALLNLPFLTLTCIAGILNAESVRRIVVARRGELGA
jgi:CDP-L-myo-inositol myo-inositolphosphotransferase